MKVLFVCLGNICRSPAAEAIFKHYLKEAGLENQVFCDSAGTSGYHHGEPADERMVFVCEKKGYAVTSVSRKFNPLKDFDEFDLLIPMDMTNKADLLDLAGNDPQVAEKIKSMTSFLEYVSDPLPKHMTDAAFIPDPYHDSDDGFAKVLALLEHSCQGLLNYVRSKLG